MGAGQGAELAYGVMAAQGLDAARAGAALRGAEKRELSRCASRAAGSWL